MSYQIGKVCGVSGDEILVNVLDHRTDETGESGVPENMIVHLPSDAGPVPVVIGQPGTFVVVALPAASLLCMVVGITMKEGRYSAGESRHAALTGALLLDPTSRALVTVPVGTIGSAGTFERGTDVLPTVNAPVFAASPQLVSSHAPFGLDDLFAMRLRPNPNRLSPNFDKIAGSAKARWPEIEVLR